MFNLFISCVLLVASCYAGGHGSGGGGGGHGGGGGGHGGGSGGAINAAVNSQRSVRVVSGGGQSSPIQPQTVVVGPENVPLNLHFESQSGNLRVTQSHEGGQGGSDQSSSVDAPWNLRHDVKRPVYQEVNEIVVPQRRITQEVRPVQETIETIISGGGGGRGGGNGGFGKGKSGGGGNGW